ncbi:radical SAM family heme chaperone HemW [Candidatus Contendibacter odensensis]|uniref:Heme chaperone HemW n=1 Tax=Candidatus Contendobacter odensis Run_B_J11 TaxID=1400861 RepID=A0A7U7GDE1_9GAMM|nr:radical SAM family heme chaperone HemW [Candidatus Contendobacter odensis]MBK8753419.1 oxygen-independent coproporphyrinogen III oxidase-like protein [Candidatus Competibacteraceae bacterium]CDH46091.1 putative oxidase [Candidatus Contendobacter odensis Run_B_J11]
MLAFFSPIPLALYLHIPWCVRKCPYCDFNSHQAHSPLPESAYVDALLRDLEQDLPRVWGRRISSLFIGGGTPSLFSAEALDRLLSGLRARLPLRPDLEITLEANPGTVEQNRFAEFRAIGINRLSIGVQSFNDGQLQQLGRIHDRRAAFAAAEAAHAAGLENFNLDLMFGLPGQTVDQALADIANAVALRPTHLSYYQLTIEPNTAFHHAPPVLPDDEVSDVIQDRARAELARHGYRQYEVSAYAREGWRCQHNLNYWEFGDYLGIGAGAHGKLTDPAAGQIHRLWKLKQPRDYLASAGMRAGIGGDAVIGEADLPVEFLMNALRLIEGVPAALFTERTGLPLAALEPALSQSRERGLLEVDRERLQATDHGLRFLNDLLQGFMSE